jgi:hypothetical protein
MTQFYANQLSNENKMITSLWEEVSCLHRGNQRKSNQVQEKIIKQKLKNQGLKSQDELLKSKIELMQMWIKMCTNPNPFHSHQVPATSVSHLPSVHRPSSSTDSAIKELYDIAVDPDL